MVIDAGWLRGGYSTGVLWGKNITTLTKENNQNRPSAPVGLCSTISFVSSAVEVGTMSIPLSKTATRQREPHGDARTVSRRNCLAARVVA